jgi:hypothetical protein
MVRSPDHLERTKNMSRLGNTVAVVTGASKGIGAAIAKQLARSTSTGCSG